MKIICERKALADMLGIIARASATKATNYILECCLLQADGELLKIAANNLEYALVSDPLDVEVIESGAVVLESRLLLDIVRKMPNDKLTISADNKHMTAIKSGSTEYVMPGLSADDFPPLPSMEGDRGFIIPSAELKALIQGTIFSISHDASKPILAGELLEVDNEGVRMVAVDGFRISLRIFNGDYLSGGAPIKAIIPGNALKELVRLIDGDDGVSVGISGGHIIFGFNKATMISRLVEGEYIAYNNMFSTDTKTAVVCVKGRLIDSLERATLLSKDAKKHPVKLNLNEGLMSITSQTELGTFYDELGIEQDGPDMEVAFNPRYLTDALKATEGERVVMRFAGPLSPCVIKQEEGEDSKYLVLPLRLR